MTGTATEKNHGHSLREDTILLLADMVLTNRCLAFEDAGKPWPKDEAEDAEKIALIMDEYESRRWNEQDPDGYQRAMDEALTAACKRLHRTAYAYSVGEF